MCPPYLQAKLHQHVFVTLLHRGWGWLRPTRLTRNYERVCGSEAIFYLLLLLFSFRLPRSKLLFSLIAAQCQQKILKRIMK